MGKLLTTQEVADLLGLRYDTARKLLVESELQPVDTIGNSKLWSQKVVDVLRSKRAAS